MKDPQFSPFDSLKTIESALVETRSIKTCASFYYILWGIVLFLYFFLHFLCFNMSSLKHSNLESYSWILFPIGGILSGLNKKNDREKETVIPFYERVYFFAFTGFAMTYGLTTILSIYFKNTLSVTLFPVLLGTTVYIVGGITKHHASIIGGIIGVMLSVIGVYSSIDYQFLFASVAALTSSLIPGLLMKNRYV